MNTLILYLVESTLCLSVLYTIFWFFLRRDTFFQVNRFYLLAMVIFSVLFPLLPIHWTGSDPASLVLLLEPVIITPAKMEIALQENLQWIEIAAVIYITGVFIFLIRFGLQLIQLRRITRRFGIRDYNGHRVVLIDRGYSPFSFFNLVFINEEVVAPESLTTILEHERIHIKQFHTLDMILIELAAVFQWFNPIIWLAGREMKSIHEYLADEGVLQNGISRSIYQQMILDETMGIRVNNLTNNFNVSLLKKRIAMMTKSKSKTWAKGKVLIALPALLVLFFFMTASSDSNADELNLTGSPAFIQGHFTPGPQPLTQDKPQTESKVKDAAVKNDKCVYQTAEKMPAYAGGNDAMVTFLLTNIKYPEGAKKNNVQGKVFVNFVVRADGSVTDVKIQRGIGSGCDEEAMRVVKLMPKWNPGMDKGKKVDVAVTLPIQFALDADKKTEPKK